MNAFIMKKWKTKKMVNTCKVHFLLVDFVNFMMKTQKATDEALGGVSFTHEEELSDETTHEKN